MCTHQNNTHILSSLQSFLVPLQGFLNAIVYGWTREDFAQLMAIGKTHFEGWDVDGSDSDTAPAAIEESEAHSMHSNITLRHNNPNEVEDTVVSDEADLN